MKKIFLLLTLLMSIIVNSQTTTWNGTSWSGPGPGGNRDAIINGNYSQLTNLTCKSLTVNFGFTFTIKSGYWVNVGDGSTIGGNFTNNGTVIVESSADFWIYNGALINNSGPNNFIIENGGGMIQNTGNISTNIGQITIKRNTKPVKLNDYTYWSSPISDQSYLSLPPFSQLRVFSYGSVGWFREWGGNMTIGKGYIAHRPIINDPNPQQIYTMSFVGVPNNGNISIASNSINRTHLVGNPYPSNLDLRLFIIVNNLSSVRLWTHNTIISSTISGPDTYNYTADDYATYNLSGGVAASSPIIDGSSNNTSVPTRYIGSGQGFFAMTPTSGPKTFIFNNSMRSYIPIATNVQFFRQAQSDTTEKHRIWLFLTNNADISRHTLVGYVEDASNNFDFQYDAEMGDRGAAIYSVLNEKKLVIQGKELPFDVNDQIPLGYKLPEGGSFQIGLNDVDGLFTDISQPIYIQDNLLGITHNLRNSNYSFTVENSGVVENRFILKFTNETLSNNDFISQSTTVFTNNTINIISTEVIKQVKVYDVLGRVILVQPGSSNSISLDTLNRTNGVLLLEVLLDNGMIVKKKVSF